MTKMEERLNYGYLVRNVGKGAYNEVAVNAIKIFIKHYFNDKIAAFWNYLSFSKHYESDKMMFAIKNNMLINLGTSPESYQFIWPKNVDGSYKTSREKRREIFDHIKDEFNKEGIQVVTTVVNGSLAMRFKWDKDYVL